jgi:DNA repair exonuclease SbcCD ATPase subunit
MPEHQSRSPMERSSTREKESFFNLEEEESGEHLDEQVQRAQEQLVQLKRQQELIEKQKRELEELSRRQEQLQTGRAEMIEQFTRSLVVLERQTYDAQKRVEQLKNINESFIQHLGILESINPKGWDNVDINKELNKALSAVDDARAEYARSRALINADADEEVLAPSGPDPYASAYATAPQQDFVYWLKNGFAFTLPLLAFGMVLLIALFWLFAK